MPSRGLRLLVGGPKPRRRVARGQPVEVLVGGSLFLWGKILTSRFLSSDVFAFSQITASLMFIPPFLRLKRPLEQAQPSMAKVGAVPKGSGEWLVLLPVVLALGDSCAELFGG